MSMPFLSISEKYFAGKVDSFGLYASKKGDPVYYEQSLCITDKACVSRTKAKLHRLHNPSIFQKKLFLLW